MTPAPVFARRCLVAAGLFALALPAAAQSGEPTTDELEALYWARQQEALEGYTEADVRFMTGMIGHHAQALIMSEMAPRNGASPAVRRLAARIINAQRDEIATMQRWLEVRGEPVPRVHIEGTRLMIHLEGGEPTMAHEGMDPADHECSMDHEGEACPMDHGDTHEGMDHAAHHDAPEHAEMRARHHGEEGEHGGMGHGGMDHASMPGMLTQAQLDELDAARGAAFDRLFLRYMIGHHTGAVVMVDELFSADGGAAQSGNTFKVASDIQVDQRTEIARMQRMLDAMPAAD